MHLHFRLLHFPLRGFSETPGSMSGGGSSTGPGAGSLSGGGRQTGGGSGAGTLGTDASSGSAFRLADDALVDTGDGKPIKYGEYKSRFVPKADADALSARYDKGRTFLLEQAEKIEKAWQALQAKGQGQPQGQPQVDPMARFRDMPVVDGSALYDAYKALNEGTITPIQQALIKQNTVLQAMAKRLDGLTGSVGSISEDRSSQQYESQLQHTIGNLGIDGLELSHESLQPFQGLVRDIAEDVYRSYDNQDPNYAKEMPGIVKSRIEGLLKMANAINRRRVDLAKDQRRRFFVPGGQASPQGPAKYNYERGDQIARRLFGTLENTGT